MDDCADTPVCVNRDKTPEPWCSGEKEARKDVRVFA